MRLPRRSNQSAKALNIPELSGGINLRDGLSEINDNQLTDSLNMWNKDGVLKTRPGTEFIGEVSTVGYDKIINPKQTDVWIGDYRLFYYNISDSGTTGGFSETGFWLQGSNKIIELPAISGGSVNFVCQQNNTVYAFIGSEQKIYKTEISVSGDDIKAGKWTLISENDYYIPTVLSYCQPSGKIVSSMDEVMASGVVTDGYNILSGYYKMEYNSYNPNAENISTAGTHPMIYPLIESTNSSKYKGKKVTLEYTTSKGTAVHTVTLTGGATTTEAKANEIDGLVLHILGRQCWLKKYNDSGELETVWVSDGGENDIVITAPYISANASSKKNKIFNMTRAEWFGGASAGLAGGTRLFLCGNTDSSEKSLVVWSGLNNPLHFAENSYFYVGNTSGAVTGFGKQSDKLIIFKENETWCTQYYQNTDITAEDLINQSVIDYASSSVYFPLTQINAYIGCAYPDTVQLCRNRLVWLSGGGKVYTLVNESQYNERSIYCVSDMISPKLKEENPENALSADWEGLYLLFIGNKVYVMDYESYGYVYISSHTKTENAQTKIPWWYWEFSGEDKLCGVISLRNRLFLVFYPEEPNGLISGFKIMLLSEGCETDNSAEIESMLTTKLFSFSSPSYRKNIDRIDLQLGRNGGEPIEASIITDNGTEEHTIELLTGDTDKNSAGYIENKAIFPCVRQVSKAAVKLSSKGKIIIGGMSIKFRVTGGIR